MKHIQTKKSRYISEMDKYYSLVFFYILIYDQNRFYGEYVKGLHLRISYRFSKKEKAQLSVLHPTSFLTFSQFQKLLLRPLQDFVAQMER